MNDFTIVNPSRIRIQAIQAKFGIKAIKVGMRLNRAATPKRCREIAEKVSGKKFKPRDYDAQIAALEEYLASEEIE